MPLSTERIKKYRRWFGWTICGVAGGVPSLVGWPATNYSARDQIAGRDRGAIGGWGHFDFHAPRLIGMCGDHNRNVPEGTPRE